MREFIQRAAGHQTRRVAVVLLAAAAIASGCSDPSMTAGNGDSEAAAQVTVQVATVAARSMGDPREQIAEVSAAVKLDVIAKSGGKVTAVRARNGEQVKKGDVLVEFDARGALLERERAALALERAKESLASSKAEAKLSRQKAVDAVKQLENQLKQQMREADTLPAEETRRNLQAAKMQLDAFEAANPVSEAQAQVDSARLTLQSMELALEPYIVKAPSDGIMSDLTLQEGMELNPGSPIGTLQKLDRIKLKAHLAEHALQLVGSKPAMLYYTFEQPGELKKAQVVYLGQLPDPVTKLYPLELEAANPDGSLRAGARVHVQLTTEEEEKVAAVPFLSIMREGESAFVYRLVGNTVRKQPISLGRVKETYQEVLSGLEQGDRVVVSGQQTLEDGQQLDLQLVEELSSPASSPTESE
ncbi:efflux RND transporter periplasmic adaptor subunit [Paenibacillus methanolicus]|uniref:RND family efflux transporter MFP subunit n=1 Tax=Paenibacillus methanolicus TaxID=582686 RepID=A0A5S5BXY1_9BACL|nr:efflux RND transporter periplasmic adaptor subunit [Paenibacillus methanolicus]TYP71897.1 RND family efflux transporter MFP subunit [Paenibacillus methanolicus]